MNRTTKIVLSGSAALGVAIGAVAGIRAAKMLGRVTEMVQGTAAESAPSDFARRQFQHADVDHARAAVQFEIKMLQQLQRVEPTSSVLNGKLGFAYTRLAMIEETAGHTSEAQAAFSEARNWAKKLHPNKDLSDDQLRSAIRKMDEGFSKLRL